MFSGIDVGVDDLMIMRFSLPLLYTPDLYGHTNIVYNECEHIDTIKLESFSPLDLYSRLSV